MTGRLARVRALLGSRAALSAPVITGFALTGFLLTLLFFRLTLGESWLLSIGISLATAALSGAVLIVVRTATAHLPWMSPRPGLVVGSIVLASGVRSVANQALLGWLSPETSISGNPLGRMAASVVIATGITLGLAGVMELSRERSLVIASLLAEQERLRRLAESMDAELLRTERELRAEARALLDPTITEISSLLQGEISIPAATEVSAHITEVVREVVRPTSHDLARTRVIALEESTPVEPTRLRPWSDRMDVTTAIHPVWVLVLCWLIVVPVLLVIPLFAATIERVVGTWLVASVLFGVFLAALRRLWPPRWRSMRVGSALAVLTAIYFAFNVVVQWWIGRLSAIGDLSGSWERVAGIGLALKVAIAMIVSVVAMLAEHGQQNRALLEEVNRELEGLIARLRRETWLLHRSVSLAVHGPLQSALVSTAMRLSSPERTEASVADARRRLDTALAAIEQDRREVPAIDEALTDLRGLWHAMVTIESRIDLAAAERLAGDAGLRQCVIEICREATSNAIRHGQATVILIDISTSEEAFLIRVLDNGSGVEDVLVAGLGMGMLDDTCLRWSLRPRDVGGAELTALVV